MPVLYLSLHLFRAPVISWGDGRMRPLVRRRWAKGMEERNADGSQQFSCIQGMDFNGLMPLCLEPELRYRSGQTGVSLCYGSWWWVPGSSCWVTGRQPLTVLAPPLPPSSARLPAHLTLIRSSHGHSWLHPACLSFLSETLPFCPRPFLASFLSCLLCLAKRFHSVLHTKSGLFKKSTNLFLLFYSCA